MGWQLHSDWRHVADNYGDKQNDLRGILVQHQQHPMGCGCSNNSGLTMTQIIFEFETQYGVFRDALHLPEDHTFTDEQIAAMKQERLTNWLAVVNPTIEAPQE